MSDEKIRIGCASAFYGDSQLSARQLVEGGNIDYLVFDYLAEATMAILAQAKAKDEDLGYARNFITAAMQDVLVDCAKKGIKIIANAGGVNVLGCVKALETLCKSKHVSLTIAGITGDDLSHRIPELAALGLEDLDTGKPLPSELSSINVYLGAKPISDALNAGADVVITGRVVDSALVLGPLMHEFGWSTNEYDKLAQGSLAGHVIECGAQCTGGNFTDWFLVPDFSNMSYPIAEVSFDGTFTVEIPTDTGGMVTPATVGEQILYEIGDPANYLLPDVACDFTQVRVEQISKNRVMVSGAKGRAPGPSYKICATYIDGYKLTGSFFMGGIRCVEKARTSMRAWVNRTKSAFQQKGWSDYRQVSLEVIGAEDTYGPHSRTANTREVMCKFGLHHNDRKALSFAAAELAYLATSASPGMSGFGLNLLRPQALMRIHSSLLEKSQVPVTIQIDAVCTNRKTYNIDEESELAPQVSIDFPLLPSCSEWGTAPLEKLVYGRSGDKGNNANIGLMVREDKFLSILHEQVTEASVMDYLAHLNIKSVTRFYLPGLRAYNFLLTEALGGGGTASLRVDNQGKALAQMLLSLEVRVPVHWNIK